MIDPKRIDSIPFRPEDMLRITGNSDVMAANARLNQVAGPAQSIYLDGNLVGCGGVRIAGVGEVWACYAPEAFEHIWDVFSKSRETIDNMAREQHLWRMWSEMSVQNDRHRAFLKRLNFRQVEAFLK